MVNQIIKGNWNTTKLISELKAATEQYPTLSKEAEEELIEKYAGDRDALNNLLFMHNIRLVFNIAKKYMGKTDDFDSMVQDGMLGLAIAAHNFDISRGVKFITYATPWVRKKVLERFYNRANEVIKRSVSMNAPASSGTSKVNDSDNPSLESYVNEYMDPSTFTPPTFDQRLSANESNQICADLYQDLESDSSLSDRDKKIFVDMFYNREKKADLQIKYDVTAKDIAQIKSSVLAKMREKLESKYGIKKLSDVI